MNKLIYSPIIAAITIFIIDRTVANKTTAIAQSTKAVPTNSALIDSLTVSRTIECMTAELFSNFTVFFFYIKYCIYYCGRCSKD